MDDNEYLRQAETLFLQSLSILEETAPERAGEIMRSFIDSHCR